MIDVPEMRFVMVDGAGDPNTSEDYRHAIEWLYSLSYPLKFMSRNELVQILHVGPYSAEGTTIARMHREFLPAIGFSANGHRDLS